MRKQCMLLVSGLLALSLAACGGTGGAPANSAPPANSSTPANSTAPADSTPPANSAPADPGASAPEPAGGEGSAWLSTRTGKFYSQFTDGMYMEYEMEYEGTVMTMVTATRGERTYSETKVGGQSTGVTVMDGEYMYTIDHASKTVFKLSLQTGGEEMVNAMIEEDDVDPVNVVSGQREIDGKTYDTEEWSMDGAKSILCFDGDRLAYMIGEFEGEETVMKVIKTSDRVDDTLFELPADYPVVAY